MTFPFALRATILERLIVRHDIGGLHLIRSQDSTYLILRFFLQRRHPVTMSLRDAGQRKKMRYDGP